MTFDYRTLNEKLEDVYVPLPLTNHDMRDRLLGMKRFGKGDGHKFFGK